MNALMNPTTVRRLQLIAFLGLAFLAIVLLKNNHDQSVRITKIERNQTIEVKCDKGNKTSCQEAADRLVQNLTPQQLKVLGERLVSASKGSNGRDGNDGKAGAVGQNGVNGKNGAAGRDGANGARGATGATGAAGHDGANGLQGPPGSRGPAGPAGPAGPRGLTGPAGPAGPIGPVGPVGPVGATAQVNIDLIVAQVQARICARLVNLC